MNRPAGRRRSATPSIECVGRDIDIRETHGAMEYPQLVRVWRSAVDATHDFLADDHKAEIERRIAADYLPNVAVVVAERGGVVVGFAGTAAGKLEMLFVDAHLHAGFSITGRSSMDDQGWPYPLLHMALGEDGGPPPVRKV